MAILILNSSGDVIVDPISKGIPEIKDLYSADKQDSSKPFFNQVITYAYYMWVNGGPYSNFSPGARDKQVCSRHLQGVSSDRFFKSQKAKAFIEFYKDSQMTVLERSIESIKKDIEDTIKELNNIPKKKIITIEVEIDIPRSENSFDTVKYPIKTQVDFDNTKEKLESYKTLDQLFINLDKLEKRALEQSMKGKKEQTARSLFDFK